MWVTFLMIFLLLQQESNLLYTSVLAFKVLFSKFKIKMLDFNIQNGIKIIEGNLKKFKYK